MKSNKTEKRVVVADGMTQAEIDLENAAQDALCNIGSAVMRGRNHEEQIALAKKLIAQVNAAGIAEKVAADFGGDLVNAILKGRDYKEQLALAKKLIAQVDAVGIAEKVAADLGGGG